MPSAAPRACGQCGSTHRHGERCPKAAARDRERKAKHDAARPSARKRGYTVEWEKASKAFLSRPENRLCACGCGRVADMVDHKIAHKGDRRLFWARTNWQPMAGNPCNRRKAIREEGAFGRPLIDQGARGVENPHLTRDRSGECRVESFDLKKGFHLMALEIIDDDEATAVSLADAKAYLKAIGDGEDTTITMMIEAAQSKVEKATDRLLITRDCIFTTDTFGAAILLPVRPVVEATAVKYFDAAGDEQTLSTDAWKLVDRLDKPRIVPAIGYSFPTTWELPGGVTVEFSSGYGDAPADAPADLRMAVLKTVRDMWSFRGDMATATVIELPEGVQAIIDDYRRWVA